VERRCTTKHGRTGRGAERSDPMARPRYVGLPTFMRAPLGDTLEGVDVGLVGLPFDGGDHSITLPILRAIARERPVGMVHFDAHCDTGDDSLGSRFHHGAPFRRAAGAGGHRHHDDRWRRRPGRCEPAAHRVLAAVHRVLRVSKRAAWPRCGPASPRPGAESSPTPPADGVRPPAPRSPRRARTLPGARARPSSRSVPASARRARRDGRTRPTAAAGRRPPWSGSRGARCG